MPAKSMKKQTFRIALILAFALLILADNAYAQSTIFSMPSTDVLDKGKVGVSLVARFKTNDDEARKKFSSFVPRVFVGTGKNIEIGANLFGNIQPGADGKRLYQPSNGVFMRMKSIKSRRLGEVISTFRFAIKSTTSEATPICK